MKIPDWMSRNRCVESFLQTYILHFSRLDSHFQPECVKCYSNSHKSGSPQAWNFLNVKNRILIEKLLDFAAVRFNAMMTLISALLHQVLKLLNYLRCFSQLEIHIMIQLLRNYISVYRVYHKLLNKQKIWRAEVFNFSLLDGYSHSYKIE